jgi:hypothetical protein
MAFVLADRVRETSTTTGTGAYALAGAVSGFRTFSSAVGNNNSCSYVVTMGSQWEVGFGTVSTAGPVLSRDAIRASSNAGAAVNWLTGTKDVRLDADANYLLGLKPVLHGPTTTTSGTTFTFSSIPAAAIKIEIIFDGFSFTTGGGVDITMQLGDSGGLETSGYTGRLLRLEPDGSSVGGGIFNYSSDFRLHDDAQSPRSINGTLILSRVSETAHRWSLTGRLDDGTAGLFPTGLKTLSAVMTQFRITTATGSTFDGGAISTRVST